MFEIIGTPTNDPIRGVCADEDLQSVEHDGKRVGRPLNNWWVNAVLNYWDYLRRCHFEQPYDADLDWQNPAHIARVKRAVAQQFGGE